MLYGLSAVCVLADQDATHGATHSVTHDMTHIATHNATHSLTHSITHGSSVNKVYHGSTLQCETKWSQYDTKYYKTIEPDASISVQDSDVVSLEFGDFFCPYEIKFLMLYGLSHI